MFRRALLAVWLLAVFPAGSGAADKTDALQQEQGSLRGRIESLSKDLARKEESRSDATEKLREVELAITEANRRLNELGRERRNLETEITELDAQTTRIERQTAAQQSQLGKLLHHHFVGGESDTLQLLLAGRDPNQAARDRYFLTKLSRAKADLISELRRVAAEKSRLADAVRERRGKLAEVEQRQQEGRAQLVEKQSERQTMLTALARQISTQRAQIGSLKRDEQRLTSLIADLAKQAARRKAKAVALAQTKAQAASAAGAGKVAGDTTRAETRTAQARPAPGKPVPNADPGAVGNFGALRGKLRLPVAGSVGARFGTPRAEGGTNWRGIFIRAADGAEVRSVAPGLVVFADWMRGFGNLIIVDHGDDFLSIYGNNETLLHGTGKTVAVGDVLASVGNSGGNPESGLYFELRHRGQPFDPLPWTRR